MESKDLSFFKKTVHEITLGVYCQKEIEPLVPPFLEAISRFYGVGVGLKDGVTIQWGWVNLRLQKQGQLLVVTQPDFFKNPLKDYTVDISWTLVTTAEQENLLQNLKIEGQEISFFQFCIMNKGCLDADQIYLTRTESDRKEFSGWYINSIEASTSGREPEFEIIYTFQFIRRRPSLIQSLVLPTGCMVIFDGKDIVDISAPDK